MKKINYNFSKTWARHFLGNNGMPAAYKGSAQAHIGTARGRR